MGIVLPVTETSLKLRRIPMSKFGTSAFLVKKIKSRWDGTGFDQAPCPECGDPSNTPWFHKGERSRNDDAGNNAVAVVLNVVLSVVILSISSGLESALLKRVF